jgi:hypothetical protein
MESPIIIKRRTARLNFYIYTGSSLVMNVRPLQTLNRLASATRLSRPPTKSFRGPKQHRSFTKSKHFKMKEAIVAKGPKVTIHNVPIPKPNADQVLIKVIYSGSNPKDWKIPQFFKPHNSGDDIAGIVESVGENVLEFKKGDRVAAFHEMVKDHGSFAEYAIAWAHTTFHLPAKTTFEEVGVMHFL